MEQGVDEITNDLQKDRVRWFGYVMRIGEERIPKNMIHKKWRESDQEDDP